MNKKVWPMAGRLQSPGGTMARTENEIKEKFEELHSANQVLADAAEARIRTRVEGPVRFRNSISAPRDTLTPLERAQALSFFTKYAALPQLPQVVIAKHNGAFYPNNIDDFRHLLNEYRPLIQNQSDSTYFQNVHGLCRSKLANKDASADLSISVLGKDGQDITDAFTQMLNYKMRAVRWMIEQCQFDYIYNGILQHSDSRFSDRYMGDYKSGEIHYLFIGHAAVCNSIRQELFWHERMLGYLAAIEMGPL